MRTALRWTEPRRTRAYLTQMEWSAVQGGPRRVPDPEPIQVPDLIIAATAESAGLVVLHDDKDFDLIAGVTGQRVQRLID